MLLNNWKEIFNEISEELKSDIKWGIRIVDRAPITEQFLLRKQS